MFLYRLLVSLALPFVVAMLFLRILRGHETADSALIRLGQRSKAKDLKQANNPAHNPTQRTIWLHAASVGELNSALPLLDILKSRDADVSLLITCNSHTGVAQARSLGFRATLAPVDTFWGVRRFAKQANITAYLAMEAEIWPNRMRYCAKRNLPIVILGGRLSEKTFRLWSSMRSLSKTIFQSISYLSAQDSASQQRFIALGTPSDALGPCINLKALYLPKQPQKTGILKSPHICLAASTHDGEDDLIVKAFLIAKRSWPELKLIIAPRHPERGGEINQLSSKQGLMSQQRSTALQESTEADFDKNDVYIADTLGDMPQWYTLATICIIGGSFVERGGHTPYEPLAHDCAILHGPSLYNFQPEFEALQTADATSAVQDAQGLATAIISLKDPQMRATQVIKAKQAIKSEIDVEQLVAQIATKLGVRQPNQT